MAHRRARPREMTDKTWNVHGRGVVAVVLLLSSSVMAACSVHDDALPAECAAPPLRMHLERFEDIEAGGPNVKIKDALAQSLPVLRGEVARHPEKAKITASTPRIYWLYLADFHIPRAKASSRTGGGVMAEHLLGSVLLSPEAGAALHSGQVLHPVSDAAGSPSGVPSFAVDYRDEDPSAVSQSQSDSSTGRVEILHLDEKTLCVDIDLHQTYRGKPAVAIVGTVRLPVVEAGMVKACAPASACTAAPRPT